LVGHFIIMIKLGLTLPWTSPECLNLEHWVFLDHRDFKRNSLLMFFCVDSHPIPTTFSIQLHPKSFLHWLSALAARCFAEFDGVSATHKVRYTTRIEFECPFDDICSHCGCGQADWRPTSADSQVSDCVTTHKFFQAIYFVLWFVLKLFALNLQNQIEFLVHMYCVKQMSARQFVGSCCSD
jgi:hypothetical protein